jgi:hypothetical protein
MLILLIYFKTQTQERERAWILASLVSKDNWFNKQTFKWNVKRFGNVKEKQPRLKEHELFEEYKKVWGMISPPHYHTMKGSGWWRVRYKIAQDAGNIIFAHPEEAKVLGLNFDLNKIESCSNEELENIYKEQTKILNNKFWTKERTKEFFKCLIES